MKWVKSKFYSLALILLEVCHAVLYDDLGSYHDVCMMGYDVFMIGKQGSPKHPLIMVDKFNDI